MNNMVFEFPGFISACTDAGYLRDLALSIGRRITELGGSPGPARYQIGSGETPAQTVAPLMSALAPLPAVELKESVPFDLDALVERIAARVAAETDTLAERFAARVAEVLGVQYPPKPPGGPSPVAESPPADIKPGE